MKTLNDLSKTIAVKNGLDEKLVHNVTKSTFEQILNFVKDEECVRIMNFGTFKPGIVAGRTTKHPSTKEEITIPPKKTIRLSLATKSKKELNCIG